MGWVGDWGWRQRWDEVEIGEQIGDRIEDGEGDRHGWVWDWEQTWDGDRFGDGNRDPPRPHANQHRRDAVKEHPGGI